MKYQNFFTFRKWFNQRFSLSFDGKFKGLSTLLGLYGERFIELLAHKLQRAERHVVDGYLRYTDVLRFVIKGHVIKLYNR